MNKKNKRICKDCPNKKCGNNGSSYVWDKNHTCKSREDIELSDYMRNNPYYDAET